MRIAIIPARGGSKRIKNKNIIDFCGKPMIAYALEAASQSGIFDKIHVSTDSDEIQATVEELGYTIDFMRPKELADDMTGLIPVYQWILRRYRDEGMDFEDVCGLMPACPLIEPEDIIRGYEKYLAHERKFPLHVVTSFPVPIEWAFRRDDEGFLTPVEPGKFAQRSQDLEKAYYEAGPFSFFHSSHLLTDTPVTDENFISITLPIYKAVDIDQPEDLYLAETLYLGRLVRSKPAVFEKIRGKGSR